VTSKPLTVVPAHAGTHTLRPIVDKLLLDDFRATQSPVVMGPCVWQFCHDGVGGKPLGPWRMTP